MPPVGFEPTISAGERPQTYALDRAATGTGYLQLIYEENSVEIVSGCLAGNVFRLHRTHEWYLGENYLMTVQMSKLLR